MNLSTELAGQQEAVRKNIGSGLMVAMVESFPYHGKVCRIKNS